ncbi:hypothetical protein WJX84_001952 [Apatococcus fuscideae]|uniref:Uncharacterized protein n=1 Tax=Apatococcus fuscideae TaxID=2026836 RepID=A0AAW1RZQ1_9CHLO
MVTTAGHESSCSQAGHDPAEPHTARAWRQGQLVMGGQDGWGIFQNLRQVGKLRELTLPECCSSEAALAMSQGICGLSCLQSLCNVPQTMACIVKLEYPSSLTRLELEISAEAAQQGLEVVCRACSLLQHLGYACSQPGDPDYGTPRLRLGGVAALSGLQQLQLPRWQVDALDLRCLSGLTLLTQLELSECSLKTMEYEAIACMSSLQFLSLTWLDQLWLEGILELTRLGRLSQLDLRHSDSSDRRGSLAAAATRSLAGMVQLESLCLRGTEVITPHAYLLTSLTRLTLLDLSECCQSQGSCVGQLTCLQRLEHLNLRWIRNLEFDFQWFRQWSDLRTLQLDFIEGVCNSAAVINQTGLRLESLSIRSCKSVNDEFLEHLACVTSLQYLDISHNDGASVAGLGHISRLPDLKVLRMQKCDNIVCQLEKELRPALSVAAKHLQGMTTLESLDLASLEGLTPQFFQVALEGLHKLESIILGATQPCCLASLLRHLPVLPRLTHMAVLHGNGDYLGVVMPIVHMQAHLPSLAHLVVPARLSAQTDGFAYDVSRAGRLLGFVPRFQTVETMGMDANFHQQGGTDPLHHIGFGAATGWFQV